LVLGFWGPKWKKKEKKKENKRIETKDLYVWWANASVVSMCHPMFFLAKTFSLPIGGKTK